jgi:Protein of unknown function (DUF2628)
MAVYTVHEPPLKRHDVVPDPERFVFVRDGFSFWAFIFGPLWMLRHRMWLVLLGYVGIVAVAEIGLHLLGVSAAVSLVVGFLLALLVGFEASTLRRFTLGRRRWANVGVIVADDLDVAERRFFDSWVGGEQAAATVPHAPVRVLPATSTDVIGLFPTQGASR